MNTPFCRTEITGVSAPPSKGQRPFRVLVVDDHILVRKATRRLLQGIPGLHVVGEAADGLEAVALARTLSPDLIIMDICMPCLDGIEATRRIKAESPNIGIIIMSSHDENLFQLRALEAGASGYLTKGTASDHLVDAVKCVITNRGDPDESKV